MDVDIREVYESTSEDFKIFADKTMLHLSNLAMKYKSVYPFLATPNSLDVCPVGTDQEAADAIAAAIQEKGPAAGLVAFGRGGRLEVENKWWDGAILTAFETGMPKSLVFLQRVRKRKWWRPGALIGNYAIADALDPLF